ncbi:MAG: hypothetical protein K6E92_10790 [Lachnospiraceae bacterium]|nr:hypothetical protein [Lachnospiraceae bacterium]
MLNEKRVILMTRMAAYEAGEGRRNMATGRYFRGDYVALQLLKAFISATLSFALILAVYVYYNFETFMEGLYEIDLMEFVRTQVGNYLRFTVVYIIIAYVVCSVKYAKARGGLRKYYNNLKKLSKLYQERE